MTTTTLPFEPRGHYRAAHVARAEVEKIVRGNAMPDLVSYLFGPGKHNEHVDQHLVAGYADSVFTADDMHSGGAFTRSPIVGI